MKIVKEKYSINFHKTLTYYFGRVRRVPLSWSLFDTLVTVTDTLTDLLTDSCNLFDIIILYSPTLWPVKNAIERDIVVSDNCRCIVLSVVNDDPFV